MPPRRTILSWAFAGLCFVATLALWHFFIRPVDTTAFQPDSEPDYYGLALLLPLVALIAVGVAGTTRGWRAVALAVTLPLAAQALLAYTVSDERSQQQKAGREFVRYTSRFPPGRLLEADVVEHRDYMVAVCAHEGPWKYESAADDRMFCLEIDPTRPEGRAVDGGFRYLDDGPGGEFGYLSLHPFDCFGDTAVCGDASER